MAAVFQATFLSQLIRSAVKSVQVTLSHDVVVPPEMTSTQTSLTRVWVSSSTGVRQQSYWELWFPLWSHWQHPVWLLSVYLLSKLSSSSSSSSSSSLTSFYTVLTCLSVCLTVFHLYFLCFWCFLPVSLSLSPSVCLYVSLSLVSMAPRDLQVSVKVWCLLCSHWLLLYQFENLFQVSFTLPCDGVVTRVNVNVFYRPLYFTVR